MVVNNPYMLIFAACTAIVNATINGLIVSRLWFHQKEIKNTLGAAYGSVYKKLIHMFIESAALVVVSSITHVILACWPNYTLFISHQFLVHIYVSFSSFSPVYLDLLVFVALCRSSPLY